MNPYASSRAIAVTASDSAYITDTVRVNVNDDPMLTTSVDLSTDIITKVAHGFSSGDRVTVPDAGTTDLSLITQYYILKQDADTFKLSISIGGSAVDIGGANTTAPTVKRNEKVVTARVPGFIYVGVAGDVNILPETHTDTNTTTAASNGAQLLKGVPAGTVIPIKVKKVFSTSTTATNMVCFYP